MVLHRRTHPTFVEGCFACRIATIRLAADATPSRREATVTQQKAWERQIRDDEAYKRLRRNGLQPERTAGCADLELVDDRRFIEPRPELWDDRAEYLADLSETPNVKVESA